MLSTVLSNSINSFFGSTKTTISSLISNMKLDKTDFESLVSKLSNSSTFGDFYSPQVAPFSFLKKEPIIELFRNSSIRIANLFSSANTSGLILDSMISIFSAELDKVEKDIKNLELFVNNYEFISGKDDLYNFTYIEQFNNLDNNYQYDNIDLDLIDRDNLKFEKDGNIFIDTNSGILKIGKNHITKNIIKNIEYIDVHTNYDNYITSQEDFRSVFTDTLTDSWNITIKSPIIITSTISEYDKYINYDYAGLRGPKAVVEVKLHTPVSMDTIKFTPNASNGLQLMQVVVFGPTNTYSSGINTKDSYKLLLTNVKSIVNSVELNFEKTLVDKFIFIFNQSTYNRSKKESITSELNSKALNNFVQERLSEKRNSFSRNQDISYWYFLRNYSADGFKVNNSSDIEYYSYKFPQELHSYAQKVEEELFSASNYALADNPAFTKSPLFLDLIKSFMNAAKIDPKIFNQEYYVETSNSNYQYNSIGTIGFIASRGSNNINDPKYQYYDNNNGGSIQNIIKNLMISESSDSYEYVFSLKSIEFIETTNDESLKGCFISKKIPVNGQILGVKAKLDRIQSNIKSPNIKYSIPTCSYELSISNTEIPVSEKDWTPIAFNNESFIDSEVIFFDITDYSTQLRFIPKLDSIIVYKDGLAIPVGSYKYDVSSQKLSLNDRMLYSSTSTFVASYLIDDSIYNPYEIDFVKRNIYSESIKQYKSKNGLGQTFSKTGANFTVTLDSQPYVNRSLSDSAFYSEFYGTIYSENSYGYNPVKVQLSDGSYATNMTNYTKSPKSVNFNSNSGIQFIHSGKNIIFNTSISSPFTVYYEYIPHNLRFRLIMRKNIPFSTIPVSADAVFLKVKTSLYDPYFDKLNYISKG